MIFCYHTKPGCAWQRPFLRPLCGWCEVKDESFHTLRPLGMPPIHPLGSRSAHRFEWRNNAEQYGFVRKIELLYNNIFLAVTSPNRAVRGNDHSFVRCVDDVRSVMNHSTLSARRECLRYTPWGVDFPTGSRGKTMRRQWRVYALRNRTIQHLLFDSPNSTGKRRRYGLLNPISNPPRQ